MNTIKATLTDEDLNLWRYCRAKLRALQTKPDWFTREEAVQMYAEETRLTGEFIRCYGVDDSKCITISSETGSIFESITPYDPAER